MADDQQLSVDDFAARVKAKYPEYANVDNRELAARVIAKYPEYAGRVTVNPPQDLSTMRPNDIAAQAMKASGISGQQQLGPAAPRVNMQEQPLGTVQQGGLDWLGNEKAGVVSAGKVLKAFGQDVGEVVNPNPMADQNIYRTIVGPAAKGIDTLTTLASGHLPQTPRTSVRDQLIAASGVNAKGVAQDASEGNVEGVIGHGIFPVAASLLAGRAMGGGESLPEGVNEGRSLSGKMIDSVIRPSVNDFKFGREPGGQVAAEGIVAGTQEGLLSKIGSKKAEIGKQLSDAVAAKSGHGAPLLDVTGAIEGPIDAAIQEAVKHGDQNLVNKLIDAKRGLTENFKLDPNNQLVSTGKKTMHLTPQDVVNLKRDVGEQVTNWNDPHANELNSVRAQVYRQLDNMVDSAVPETKDLNSRYSNLLTAEKALSRANAMREKHDLIGLKDTASGALAATGSALAGHTGMEALTMALAGILVRRGMESSAAKTVAAQMLRSNAPGSTVGSIAGAGLAGNVTGNSNNANR